MIGLRSSALALVALFFAACTTSGSAEKVASLDLTAVLAADGAAHRGAGVLVPRDLAFGEGFVRLQSAGKLLPRSEPSAGAVAYGRQGVEPEDDGVVVISASPAQHLLLTQCGAEARTGEVQDHRVVVSGPETHLAAFLAATTISADGEPEIGRPPAGYSELGRLGAGWASHPAGSRVQVTRAHKTRDNESMSYESATTVPVDRSAQIVLGALLCEQPRRHLRSSVTGGQFDYSEFQTGNVKIDGRPALVGAIRWGEVLTLIGGEPGVAVITTFSGPVTTERVVEIADSVERMNARTFEDAVRTRNAKNAADIRAAGERTLVQDGLQVIGHFDNDATESEPVVVVGLGRRRSILDSEDMACFTTQHEPFPGSVHDCVPMSAINGDMTLLSTRFGFVSPRVTRVVGTGQDGTKAEAVPKAMADPRFRAFVLQGSMGDVVPQGVGGGQLLTPSFPYGTLLYEAFDGDGHRVAGMRIGGNEGCSLPKGCPA